MKNSWKEAVGFYTGLHIYGKIENKLVLHHPIKLFVTSLILFVQETIENFNDELGRCEKLPQVRYLGGESSYTL